MGRLVRIAIVLGLMFFALEAMLHLVPLPDPYADARLIGTRQRVHLFLPGWNVWTGWFGESPPFVRTFSTGRLTGVSTTSVQLHVNRFGFLYDEARSIRGSKQELRVGVVGGSTVESSAIELKKRWPDVLEQILSRGIDDRTVVVFNLGVSGTDTRTYLATVAQHAVKLDLHYLVFMLGANDMFRANSVADPLDREDAFWTTESRTVKAVLLQLQLLRRLRVLYNKVRGTEHYIVARGVDHPYFAARIGELSSLPVLPTARVEISEQALSDYEANIVSLSALAMAHGIVPMFTTQPMLWKPHMNAKESAVDWLAGTVVRDGRQYRVPSSEQARALETLNKRLLDVCRRRKLKCIDLDALIPRSLEFFYDSLHLNEAGAERVAQHVAEVLSNDMRAGGRRIVQMRPCGGRKGTCT